MQLITLHTAIACSGCWAEVSHRGQLAGHSATKLWYWLRSLDDRGSGRVDFDIRVAAAALNRSIYTIRRWLKWGIKLNLFRSVSTIGYGTRRVFLSGIVSILRSNNISSLGAIGSVEVSRLVELPIVATELQAESLQRQSKFLAERQHKRKAAGPSEILTPSQSASGGILFRGGRFTFLRAGGIAYGGSHRGMATRLGRHESTVQRHLTDHYRDRHSLPPVRKTQIAQAGEAAEEAFFFASEGDHAAPAFQLPGGGKAFTPRCNIYHLPGIELKGKRYLRSTVRRRLGYQNPPPPPLGGGTEIRVHFQEEDRPVP